MNDAPSCRLGELELDLFFSLGWVVDQDSGCFLYRGPGRHPRSGAQLWASIRWKIALSIWKQKTTGASQQIFTILY